MQLSIFAILAIASSAICSIIPRADNKGSCGCPTFGPEGTCLLTRNPFLSPDTPGSAVCGTKGFNYVCDGTYNNPNCNACFQSVIGNMKQPGRTKQCKGSKFCSSDNGASFHICADNETPFVPQYYADISFDNSDSAVIASGTFDLNWFHDTLPKWFSSVCYETSCQQNPTWPSQSLGYAGTGFGLAQGKLTLGISESQFGDHNQRDLMVKLASLAIIRATKCEQQTWRDKCTKTDTDCSPQKITVCKGPSDANIRLLRWDNDMSDYNPHSWIHFSLNWNDNKTPFDCSILDLPFSITDGIADHEPELEGFKKVTGFVTTACKGIESLLKLGSK